jgi:hypothetical protein
VVDTAVVLTGPPAKALVPNELEEETASSLFLAVPKEIDGVCWVATQPNEKPGDCAGGALPKGAGAGTCVFAELLAGPSPMNPFVVGPGTGELTNSGACFGASPSVLVPYTGGSLELEDVVFVDD